MVYCHPCPPPDEEWRRSRSFPWYEVSDHERLRRAVAAHCHPAGRILKGSTNRDGYKVHVLYREDGPPKQVFFHLLVMEEFGPPRPSPRHQTRHGPNGNGDNHPANLCWGTSAENAADKIRDGTYQGGERHWKARLTAAQVAEMRARYAAGGVSYRALAAEYGVRKTHVSKIICGESWREPGAHPGTVPVSERRRRDKLTVAQVAEIRARYAAGGLTCRALAAEYGVSHSQVSNIIRGKTRRDGYDPASEGGRPRRIRLAAATVAEIRARHAAGDVTYGMLAAEYGITPAHASRIIRRVQWPDSA